MALYRLTAEYLRARDAEGMTVAAIARHAGVSKEAVRQALKRHKVTLQRRYIPFGSDGKPKIADATRESIAGLASAGQTASQIAAGLGISRCTVLREAALRGIALPRGQGGCKPNPRVKKPRPLTRAEIMAQLTESQRADYRILRARGGYTPDQALRSIRRADLIGATTAILDAAAAGHGAGGGERRAA